MLSIKSECLGKLILLGEGHLRRAVSEFVAHYHLERPHQGLGNELITPTNNDAGTPANDNAGTGEIEYRERLGGLLKHYRRKAA